MCWNESACPGRGQRGTINNENDQRLPHPDRRSFSPRLCGCLPGLRCHPGACRLQLRQRLCRRLYRRLLRLQDRVWREDQDHVLLGLHPQHQPHRHLRGPEQGLLCRRGPRGGDCPACRRHRRGRHRHRPGPAGRKLPGLPGRRLRRRQHRPHRRGRRHPAQHLRHHEPRRGRHHPRRPHGGPRLHHLGHGRRAGNHQADHDHRRW